MMNSKYKDFLVILFLSVTGLCVVGQLYMPLPLLKDLSQQYPFSSFSSSWIVSAFGYAYAFGFLIFGPLSDRLGRYWVIVLGLVSLVIITAVVALSESANTLLLTRILQGFAAASFPPVALAYVNENLRAKMKGLAVACLSFSFLAAIALAQVFVLALEANSLALPESIISVAYIFLLIILSVLLVKDKPKVIKPLASILFEIPKLLINKSLWMYYFLAVNLLFIFVGFYVSFSGQMANFFSPLELRLLTLPFFATCFFATTLSSKLGSKKALLLSLILSISALLIMYVALKITSSIGIFLALSLLSSAVALLVPLLISCIAQNAPIDKRGTAVSLYTFLLFCGASAAPLIFKSLLLNSSLLLMISLLSFSFFAIMVTKHEK